MNFSFKSWLLESKDWHSWDAEDATDFAVHYDRMLDDGITPKDIGDFAYKIYGGIPRPQPTYQEPPGFEDLIDKVIKAWQTLMMSLRKNDFESAMYAFDDISYNTGDIKRSIKGNREMQATYGKMLQYMVDALKQVGKMLKSIESPEWKTMASAKRIQQKWTDVAQRNQIWTSKRKRRPWE